MSLEIHPKMDNPIWYSLDTTLATRNHHSVSIEDALRIVRDYFSAIGGSYARFEEAMSATTVGFARSEGEFIEIGMVTHVCMLVKIELPLKSTSWLSRLIRGPVFQYEETLSSLDDVESRVHQFFTMTPEEFVNCLQAKRS